MGRLGASRIYGIVILLFLSFLLILPACRKEAPPLDRNIAPETFLTAAPPETTETDYRVHLYWYGKDTDGTVVRYMFYVTDTLMTLNPEEEPNQDQLDWNPAQRGSDYVKGRFTTKTDSVFIFKGYNDRVGSMVNRQAFHIVAIDDGGKMDPTPARLQFLARVKGLPRAQFWLNVGNGFYQYEPQVLDTISMFIPFSIRFFATTVNNVITGYRWNYGQKTYPDVNNDGTPEWYIPSINPPETVTVNISNQGDQVQPSGVFNFKLIARDEAGALSKSDPVTGEGICKVVINHDPDTRVIDGQCFYTPAETGVRENIRVDFSDGIPDTLPYNSILRLDYLGWDDKRDLPTLEYDPPLPIKFQFRYLRWYYNEEGAQSGRKLSSWYPFTGPEDTNPGADLDDPTRDQDSTSIRVGSYNYNFLVRSFDEQNRADGTPDTVSFVGNFLPIVDSLSLAYKDFSSHLIQLKSDTVYLGWKWLHFYNPDTVMSDMIGLDDTVVVAGDSMIVRYYKLILQAWGHDDRRDPPGSGIRTWRFNIYDPDYDYHYIGENEFLDADPVNVLSYDFYLKIKAPLRQNGTDSLVNDPPPYLGEQLITVKGMDLGPGIVFKEGIRGITPKFDSHGNVIPGDNWIIIDNTSTANARQVSFSKKFYFKLVY